MFGAGGGGGGEGRGHTAVDLLWRYASHVELDEAYFDALGRESDKLVEALQVVGVVGGPGRGGEGAVLLSRVAAGHRHAAVCSRTEHHTDT